MPDLLLLPSPLLGPAVWAPVGERLGARVAEPAGATDVAAVLAAFQRAGDGLADLVLVPHSNAGLYAPLLAERLGARATVYVDAALPDGAPRTGLARTGFLERLRDLADEDEVLPPWTQWWDDVGHLFPDAATRRAVEREQPRMPLSYFTSRVDVPPGWTDRPCAYLAFGDTYAEEIGFALAHDWPLTALPGDHLHQLVAPVEVAAAITDLVRRVTA